MAGYGQTRDALIDHLAGVHAPRARASFLRRHRELIDPAVVDDLYGRVVRLARVDVEQADRLALAARWIADTLADDVARAQSIRAQGHVCFIRGEHKAALTHYDAAAKLYRRARRDVDVARTLNGSIQSLISLGKYTEAHASARRARALFERHGVALGLARLDTNIANIFSRQDQWDKALPLYERAHAELSRVGEPQDVAAVLSNLALAHINLNDFERALTTYRAAREYCQRHGMPLLVLQADYNIAYLYYLRGEYTQALELYRTAYDESERVGDGYHSGLCDLDRSEIYLELNLSEEAADLADRALGRFGRLRMLYEEGKAVTNLALAASRRGGIRRSRTLFARARRLAAEPVAGAGRARAPPVRPGLGAGQGRGVRAAARAARPAGGPSSRRRGGLPRGRRAAGRRRIAHARLPVAVPARPDPRGAGRPRRRARRLPPRVPRA